MKISDNAICLKIIDYSETSQVAHLFTREHGILGAIAKGSKRSKSKTQGALDLFSQGNVVISQRNPLGLGTVTEFRETHIHTGLRKDSRRLYTGLYMLELVSAMLGEADPHRALFDLLQNSLIRLSQDDAPIGSVLAYFQWRLLRHTGLLTGVEYCAGCGLGVWDFPQDRQTYFSSKAGGILCPSCELGEREKSKLSSDALSGLCTLAQVERGLKAQLSAKQSAGVNRMLAYHICHQVGRKLRMIKHVIE